MSKFLPALKRSLFIVLSWLYPEATCFWGLSFITTLSLSPTRTWYELRRYSECERDPMTRSPKSDHVTEERKAMRLPPALISTWYVCSEEAEDHRAIPSAFMKRESPVEKSALFVWKSITPPSASLPYIVAPGPKIISVRSIMLGSRDITF